MLGPMMPLPPIRCGAAFVSPWSVRLGSFIIIHLEYHTAIKVPFECRPVLCPSVRVCEAKECRVWGGCRLQAAVIMTPYCRIMQTRQQSSLILTSLHNHLHNIRTSYSLQKMPTRACRIFAKNQALSSLIMKVLHSIEASQILMKRPMLYITVSQLR